MMLRSSASTAAHRLSPRPAAILHAAVAKVCSPASRTTNRLGALLFAAALALPSMAPAATDIQVITTPGGITAWLVEDHSIPFAALEIRFRGGSSIESEDKIGATYLMTGLLNEGAGDLDAIAFLERQEELAAVNRFRAYTQAVSVSAQFLTENRDESIELLRSALTEPRFDEEPFERVRRQVLSIIADLEKDPEEIAALEMRRLQFGDHPYAHPLEGTAESVSALTIEDMREIHAASLTRDGAIVGAAGDITPEELALAVDRLLGDLPKEAPEMPGRPEYLLEGGTTLVDFPSPQSVARFAHEGMLREDPDFLTAYVLNEIFGGRGYTARLNDEVRIKRGLTYGVGTFLAAYSNSGQIIGQLNSANERVAEAVEVVRQEWLRLAEDGVTEQELADAKTYLTGAYPLRFDGNGSIARILAGMQFDHLPASYVKNRNDMVNALTLEEINAVARRLMKPDELHFVVVGEPEGLADGAAN